jgi:BolA family transcriptional regulator, general stress-responsive regulator
MRRQRFGSRCRGHDLQMRVQETISRKLTETFAPVRLKVLDESHQHEGHAGHRPGGETHFRIYIVADAFRGKSRIVRHRMINETLTDELESGVHALAIHAAAPDEVRS